MVHSEKSISIIENLLVGSYSIILIANVKPKESCDVPSYKGVENVQQIKVVIYEKKNIKGTKFLVVVEQYFSSITNLVNKIELYKNDIEVLEKMIWAMLMKFNHVR